MKAIKKAEKKTYQRDHQLSSTVLDIIDSVRANGDRTLLELAEKFDHVQLQSVKVDPASVAKAYQQVDQETVDHIRFAADQIRWFAEQELQCMQALDVQSKVPGVRLGHRLIPVEKCGCYIPSGRYPLPSSALMSVVTAKVAGVKHVAACSPAFHGCGTVHPAVLVAMDIAGADEIYCMGGAQAIAAYAYGTETVKKVDMIVGPGNKFVTEAKRQVLGDVGIDSLAGPSEVLIVADDTANPTFLAIDLLAPIVPSYQGNMILVALFAGLCEGLGLSLTFLRGATTGGTDMLARLLGRRKPHLSMGKLMLAVDGLIVLASAFVYGSIENAMYACIVIFVSTRLIDSILYGTDVGTGKLFFVMSPKVRQMGDRIIREVDRTVTYLDSHGGYTNEPGETMLCAVRRFEVFQVQAIIREEDRDAFVIVGDAGQITGEGFRSAHSDDKPLKELLQGLRKDKG